MAQTPKRKRKAAAPEPQTTVEKSLTKGQLRKLNALRKSVGDKLGDEAFSKWLKKQGTAKNSEPADKNAELIAETLMKLIDEKKVRIPRGGYLVTRGRGRVIVEQPVYG